MKPITRSGFYTAVVICFLIHSTVGQDAEQYPPFMENILDKIEDLTPNETPQPELSKFYKGKLIVNNSFNRSLIPQHH